jgi:hypothetical protein
MIVVVEYYWHNPLLGTLASVTGCSRKCYSLKVLSKTVGDRSGRNRFKQEKLLATDTEGGQPSRSTDSAMGVSIWIM